MKDMNDLMFRAYPTLRPVFSRFRFCGYREMQRRHRLKFGAKLTSQQMYEQVRGVLAEAYVAYRQRELMTQ